MSIDLGLTRITKLLKSIGNPHISSYSTIHIAGTNGKGSTVAYLSSILTKATLKNGRFTSPSTIRYNDCICINNEVYPMKNFNAVSDKVKKENDLLGLNCTEFELLTATAFKIFEIEKVHIAIVEVGLGGRLDATNVLFPKLYSKGSDVPYRGGVVATGITKIGIDHEKFLGSCLSDIAFEKAGIIKPNIPCVLDRSNDQSVIARVEEVSIKNNAPLYLVDGHKNCTEIVGGIARRKEFPFVMKTNQYIKYSKLAGSYQAQNLSVALALIDILISQKHSFLYSSDGELLITENSIKDGVSSTYWPGRLQHLRFDKWNIDILLDGAHNESAAIELGRYLETYDSRSNGIIFAIAMTEGKGIDGLLKHIVTNQNDTIITTEFTQPENMPWIKSYNQKYLAEKSRYYCKDVIQSFDPNCNIAALLDKIKTVQSSDMKSRKIVMCGSLYFCSDILRFAEDKT